MRSGFQLAAADPDLKGDSRLISCQIHISVLQDHTLAEESTPISYADEA